jgi:hypothetical protein
MLKIIAGVNDDRQSFGRMNLRQSIGDFGSAYATGQDDDVQFLCAGQPFNPWRREGHRIWKLAQFRRS